MLIRKKTFSDRIINLIHHTALDFNEDQSFSKYFYVAASDKEKALAAMTKEFRNALMEIQLENFIIEINNNVLLMGSSAAIDAKQIINLVNCANRLSAVK